MLGSGFEAEFVGGYLSRQELRSLEQSWAEALADERLGGEHRDSCARLASTPRACRCTPATTRHRGRIPPAQRCWDRRYRPRAVTSDSQTALDDRNAGFWDELCGSSLARQLGITDASAESLARFDAAYRANTRTCCPTWIESPWRALGRWRSASVTEP